MFEKCQNCLKRPASLHCLTCQQQPRYHTLCYDCDSMIHHRLKGPHHKQYIQTDLSSLRAKPLPQKTAVYTHTPFKENQRNLQNSHVQRNSNSKDKCGSVESRSLQSASDSRQQWVERVSGTDKDRDSGKDRDKDRDREVKVVAQVGVGVQTSLKGGKYRAKIAAMERLLQQQQQRHQLMLSTLTSNLQVVKECEQCYFRLK